MSRKQESLNTAVYAVSEPMELRPYLLKVMYKSRRNSVKSILTRGQVTVNGQMIKQHKSSLQTGQTVAILSNQAAQSKSKLIGVSILHEDEDLIVINKNAGLLSVASKRENELTAYRQVTDYVRRSNSKNRIFIVHRLDKDTSGVMVFANSEKVQHDMQNGWTEVVKERMYTALLEG